MGQNYSTCLAANVSLLTQRCDVSPFASPNPMCVDPDPSKCNLDTQLKECGPGYYCPNVTADCPFTFPTFCPPTVACATARFGSSFCDRQGPYEPLLCLPGMYCPNATAMLPCAAGTFCTRGSTAPRACSWLSHCPERTEMRRYYGGVLFCVVIDLALLAVFYVLKYRLEPAAAKRRRAALVAARASAAAGGEDGFELAEARAAYVPPGTDDGSYAALADADSARTALTSASSKSVLEDGFRKCNAGIRLDIAFDGLSLALPAPLSKTILSGVTGRIRPGRVTAIMGPSGAGKTTFLNVLMGKLQRTDGVLRINGVADEMFRYKKMIGFVPQDDTMMMELTVRENILYSARVRLPRHGWTDAAVQRHVDAVIDVLGLFPCADTLAGSVSGGQRKRANIGLELAVAPAAIFLDEPTSGLDSTAALEVCRTLKSISELGLTVVAVIHQPRTEIFRSFDDLLLLAPGGLTVFMGPQRASMGYFGELGVAFQDNPADDLLDFVAGSGPVCAGAVEDGALRALTQARGGGGGSPDASFSSVAPPAGALPPLGTQLAEYWRLAGMARLAAQRAASGAPATPVAGGAELLGAPAALSARSSVQGGGASSSSAGGGGFDDDDAEHAPIDVEKSTGDRGASFLRQVALAHSRSLVQQYRTVTGFALELGVALLAGGMMGAAALAVPSLYIGVLKPPYVYISPSPVENLLPSIGLFVALAIGVAASPAGVKIFGEERPVFFREASAGHNRYSYYTAKSIAVLFRLTLGAYHFVSIFHLLARPATGFELMFLNVWCQYFCVYGLAAITSMLVKRENSALLGVIVSLIAACLNGYGPNLVQGRSWGVGWVQDMSFARWANEAWFHSETLPYRDHFMAEEVSAATWGYTLNRFGTDVALMVVIGVLYRAVAFGLLIGLNREAQR